MVAVRAERILPTRGLHPALRLGLPLEEVSEYVIEIAADRRKRAEAAALAGAPDAVRQSA